MMRSSNLITAAAALAIGLAACGKPDTPGSDDEAADDGDTSDGDGDRGDAGDDGNDDSMFIPTEDDLGSANTCDPWLQDCPEDEKCVAYASAGGTWDANRCVAVMGDATVGDECTYNGAAEGSDTCALGHMCYYINEDAVGICVEQCTGNPDNPQCGSDFNCSVSNDGSLLLCLFACDPLLQDCEQDGTGCYWDLQQFNCDPTVGAIPTGETCGFINDCDVGNACLAPEATPGCAGSGCCAAFCNLSDPTCSIAETECTAFFTEGTAPPGLEDVGVCVLPAP